MIEDHVKGATIDGGQLGPQRRPTAEYTLGADMIDAVIARLAAPDLDMGR